MSEAKERDSNPGAPMSGCLLQVVWSILAPGLILVAGSLVVAQCRPPGSAPDWFLLGAVMLAIAARSLDPTKPVASGTDEAQLPNPLKYTLLVVAGGALCFVIGHFVAPVLF